MGVCSSTCYVISSSFTEEHRGFVCVGDVGGGEVCFYPCDEFDAFSFRCLVTSVDSGGGPVVGERDCWLPELGGSFHCFAGCAEAVKDGCVGVDM